MIEATLTRPNIIAANGVTLTHRTPVLQLCRELLSGMVLPLTAEQDRMTVVDAATGKPVMHVRITAAARSSIVENDHVGPKFGRWAPFVRGGAPGEAFDPDPSVGS